MGAEIFEEAEGLLAVADFVAEIVGDAAEGVDVAEILAEIAREEKGNDGEVFVMGLRELARLILRGGEVFGGRAGHVDS